MATSSSYNFSVNRNEIIIEALSIIGEYAAGETISADDISTCSRSLNLMIKHWQTKDYGLWLNKEIVLFLQANTVKYYLGATGISSYSTYAVPMTNYVKTEVATALASAGTALVVDSISGFSDGDYIGVETDNNDIHWDTINGAPAGTTITLTTGVDYACSVGNHVYGAWASTEVIQRPLDIMYAVRRDEDDNDTQLYIGGHEEYLAISDKDSESIVNQLFYDRQLTNGVLYTWPESDNVKDRIILIAKYPVQDFDSATNDCDFPQEWQGALCWNLAKWIAPKFGSVITQDINMMAFETLENASTYDNESPSIRIKVRRR